MQEIESVVANVEGWLSTAEGRCLYRLARKCQGRGVIVEIGSWKGKSTIWLGNGSLDGKQVTIHAIDPHTGSPQCVEMFGEGVWTFNAFQQNIEQAGVKDVIEPHIGYSVEVASTFEQPVEMIFIDGLHEWDGVKADFDAWYPKVVEGGWMVFHDSTCWPDVLRLVKDYVFKSQHFRKIRWADSIVYAQKTAQNTRLERLANRIRLGLFLVHAWYGRTVYRLYHNYLECAATRAIINYVRRRRTPTASPKPVPAPLTQPISQP
jgi:predicted O-methyltransferase YrrM